MVKISVNVSDSKDDDTKCIVKVETPTEKQLEKASETEKSTAAVVYNTIMAALGKLN